MTFHVMMRLVAVGIASLLLALVPKPARAYDPDTHYQVTYILCRAAGMNHDDALVVAQCDQGMDDSTGTLANGGPGGAIPNVREEGLWHALPEKPDPNLVLTRKKEMFERAIGMPDRARKLQYLGVFFHYQQDTWAHRVHPSSHPTRFIPYFQPLGHGLMGHQPDRPPFDPVCAVRCLEEGIDYARQFMTRALGQKPGSMFDNYTPATAGEDSSWSGKGMFIHQIVIDNSNNAHRFVTTLIRAQIDSYTNGLEIGNPNYTGYYTSNEADYSKVRGNLQRVCAQFGVPTQIPATFVPFSTLNTPLLLAGSPLPIPAPAPAQKIIRIQSVANGQFICASDGLKDNQWLYCKPGTPVEFTVLGPLNNCTLKVNGQNLYFSYNATTGAVKLWSTPGDANFSLERQGNGTYAIRSLKYNQYVWLSGQSPYITRSGSPGSASGQWNISGL